MQTKSPNLFLQLKSLLMNLSVGKITGLLCLFAVIIVGFILLVIWTGSPELQLLYSNLSPEDAGEIISRLKERKIPYQISSNGKSILIPREVVYETRLDLANEGLPQGSGVGFEIFDNTKLGMTEFVQNVNYQRALQGELSRTINGFDEVESSRVHIVMPSKSLFIEENEPATASVVLKLRRGRLLSEGQVRGIVHLISASVSQLNPENVTIVDNNGKLLAGSKDQSITAQLSSDQLEFQEKVERNLEKRIETMLEKVLGPGKAIARLSCSFDFRRQEKTEEIYDPEGKVVRSEQVLNTVSNRQESIAMGVPGVVSNMLSKEVDDSASNTEGGLAPEYQKQDKTVNYEIGKITSHTVEPVGKIERISVAVVVDGAHNLVKGEESEEEWQYTSRTQEELMKIEDIVKRAVNFNSERGDEIEVVNIPFEAAKMLDSDEKITDEGWLSELENYTRYLKYIFLATFLLLSFLFIVRPLVRWLTVAQPGSAEILKQLPMTVEEIERGYGEGKKGLPYRDRVMELLAGEDEDSLKITHEWLAEK